jgi:hypothetical protein
MMWRCRRAGAEALVQAGGGGVERAAETGHSAAAQAAGLAFEGGVQVALTHVSPRCFGVEIAREVREILWAASAAVLAVIGSRVDDWFSMTDELRYERLAISIARSHSLVPRMTS